MNLPRDGSSSGSELDRPPANGTVAPPDSPDSKDTKAAGADAEVVDAGLRSLDHCKSSGGRGQ